MDQVIINNLKKELLKRKDFQTELFFIDNYTDFLSITNHIYMDQYISYSKITKLKNFISKYLRDHKQKGFFYISGLSFEINESGLNV